MHMRSFRVVHAVDVAVESVVMKPLTAFFMNLRNREPYSPGLTADIFVYILT